MIRLGFDSTAKQKAVADYVSQYGVSRVVVLSPEKFRLEFPEATEHVEYSQIIKYKVFYRLLQEIDANTLVVVNECMRTQNRSDLTYNCMRHFLSQTQHQIVFQYLPIIDAVADWMILVDFDTQSRWKGLTWDSTMLPQRDIQAIQPDVQFTETRAPVTKSDVAVYEKKRESLFRNIGLKDPHTIPRNLYLETGKAKLRECDPTGRYVGRNNRFNLSGMVSYRDSQFTKDCIVFEFPHNVIDFSDYLSLSGQTQVQVLTTELKCDQWYLNRYKDWWGRVGDAYASFSNTERDRSDKGTNQLRFRFV